VRRRARLVFACVRALVRRYHRCQFAEKGSFVSVPIKSLGIDRLAVEDRLDLVGQVWDSIAADSVALPLTDAQRIELERRVTDHEQNPDDVVSWDEIRDVVSKHLP
jgi:putative addiction module component (TIGR02574 family)